MVPTPGYFVLKCRYKAVKCVFMYVCVRSAPISTMFYCVYGLFRQSGIIMFFFHSIRYQCGWMKSTVMEQNMIYINVDQTDGECLIVDTLKMSPLYVACNGMEKKHKNTTLSKQSVHTIEHRWNWRNPNTHIHEHSLHGLVSALQYKVTGCRHH
jgi:hypothetical protein